MDPSTLLPPPPSRRPPFRLPSRLARVAVRLPLAIPTCKTFMVNAST